MTTNPTHPTPISATNPAASPSIWLASSWRARSGVAYGMQQSAVVGRICIDLGGQCDQTALQRAFATILGEPATQQKPLRTLQEFCERLIHWAVLVQQRARWPTFDAGLVVSVESSQTKVMGVGVAVPCANARVAIDALQWTVATAASIAAASNTAALELVCAAAIKSLASLVKVMSQGAPGGVNVLRILKEAHRNKLPFQRISGENYVIGHGVKSRWLRSTFTDQTSLMGSHFAREKNLGAQVLSLSGLPVAPHHMARTVDQALAAAATLGYPVVIKPADRDGGVGVHAGLSSPDQVRACFAEAQTHSKHILVEKHIEGADYRLTIFEGAMVKAIQRLPGGVIGNGQHTIAALLETASLEPTMQRRSAERGKPLLSLDDEALQLLADAGLNAESIPAQGLFVRLRRRANVSTGGTTRLVTDRVHADNRRLAERAANVMRLDIAGIDLIMPDIATSWLTSGGVICEVNAQPQIGETDTPGLYAHMLQQLLGGNGRIPVALVLGQHDSEFDDLLACTGRAFCQHSNGTAYAAANRLRLDDEELSRAPLAFFAAAQAALHCRQAQRVVMAATPLQLLTQGLPSANIDLLLIWTLTHAATPAPQLPPEALANFVLPHLRGPAVVFADDPLCAAFAAYVPPSRLILVSLQWSAQKMAEHLGQGATGIWLEACSSPAQWTICAGTREQIRNRDTLTLATPDHTAATALQTVLAAALTHALSAAP